MGQRKLADVERERLGSDVYKHPLIPQLPVMDPIDNLPKQSSAIAMSDTLAPALEPETFVCMADESEFVVRDDWGVIELSFQPARVQMSPNGGYYVVLTKEERLLTTRPCDEKYPQRLAVQPLRPQCDRYKRVMTDFEQTDHRQVERVCAAQRSETGEYVSLRDTRVYACEHRYPRDFVSEERLRRFDAKLVERSKKQDEEWTPPEEA